MKKLVVLLFALTFGLVLIGCEGATTAAPTTAAPTTAAPTTAAPTTAAPTTAAPTTAAPTTAAPTTAAPTTAAPTTEVVVELKELYSGTHTVSAMGSDVVYVYHMSFVDGDYEFYSTYEMGGLPYDFYEFGTYSVSGNVITLTPDGQDAVSGTIGQDSIQVPVKASTMGARAERTLTEEDELELALLFSGSHTVSAMGSDVVYSYTMLFEDGEYAFYSTYQMGGVDYDYEEAGTYTLAGLVLTITPDEQDPVVGQLHVNGSITIGVKPSQMGARAARTLSPLADLELAAEYEGTHTVSAMGSDVVYTYTLSFEDGEYSFVSDFEMGGVPYQFTETGTYEVEGNVLTLTPLDGEPQTGVIHLDGSIEAPVKASEMGARALRTMTPVEEEVE